MVLLLQLAKLAALIALTVVLVFVALAVHQLTPKAEYTFDNTNRAVREISETAANLRHATEAWKKASDDQTRYATAASLAAKKSFEDFDTLVKRTDFQLNEQVLPQMGSALAANSTQLVELEKSSQETFTRIAADADKLTADTSEVMKAAARNLNDPSIPLTLARIQRTSEETAATAADIRQVTDKVREEYLKPQKFAWALLKELAGLGGSMAQMIK